MQSLSPHTDANAKRWHDMVSAEKLLEGQVTISTIWSWTTKGVTTWGLNVESLRIPLLKNGHDNRPVKRRMQSRILISEASCLLLRELFHRCAPQHRAEGRGFTLAELRDLRSATAELQGRRRSGPAP